MQRHDYYSTDDAEQRGKIYVGGFGDFADHYLKGSSAIEYFKDLSADYLASQVAPGVVASSAEFRLPSGIHVARLVVQSFFVTMKRDSLPC